jgi:alpha-beta hydrolase superfamily lysophospholipase
MAQFGLGGALKLLGLPKTPRRDVPILIVQGGEDSLGNEKSVAALAARYVKAGYSDVELIIYAGARHEIFFETNRSEVWKDLFAWVDARMGKAE